MRFAHDAWLWGTLVAPVVALLLLAGARAARQALRRFGDPVVVTPLITDHPTGRRALRGALVVLGVALAFVAAAQPQYGRGTRVVPATNLDVVLAVDYSKSMYARDVSPSRTERAKSEIARLIAALPGARFAAVAFAGEPISFPLTSDGGAIAQFLRQLSPGDLPVGGTAIARAMESALELLRRDPLAARHRRVIVLITDGEDLEGSPHEVAERAAAESVTIHVVQIGGRTPEPIPEVDEQGRVVGWRKDSRGRALTTELSAEGEAELARVAELTSGSVVRSDATGTGLARVSEELRALMTGELSERVETIYADVSAYPAALAALLLAIEAFVPEARRRRRGPGAAAGAVVLLAAVVSGCEDGAFVRNSPVVDDALEALDGGDPGTAAGLLEDYLGTGACADGNLAAPETVRSRPNASFDLGLALFGVAER
ncbi:MAG: VWA domain-containing protein, partial [Deltaproteobacteria bacterium]|nr:VWA domain-containing protein [Deltaproteobacteria bacterium]